MVETTSMPTNNARIGTRQYAGRTATRTTITPAPSHAACLQPALKKPIKLPAIHTNQIHTHTRNIGIPLNKKTSPTGWSTRFFLKFD
jgi:hypothetical protein